MQSEQPRGLAAAAQQYGHQGQASNSQPVPQSNMGYNQPNQPNVLPSQQMNVHPPEQTTTYPPPPPLQPPYSANYASTGSTSATDHMYGGQQHEDEVAPPLPQRHQDHFPPTQNVTGVSNQQPYASAPQHEQAPPLPQRHQNAEYHPLPSAINAQVNQAGQVQGLSGPHSANDFVTPPPHRQHVSFPANDDPAQPAHYTRDPHKLVGYLVPFPKPQIKGIDPAKVPTRFLIYTPPPPPLAAPKEGEKEAKLHKVQRKWQEEVRSAKTSTAPIKSWQGVKSRATKAIAWGVNQTTTSNLEFLGRVSDGNKTPTSATSSGRNSPDSPVPNKTVGVNEMLLVYPPSMGMDNHQMREEFVNSMLRTKSKAQRDSIIATGLLPVGYGIDILATLIWPFGGLGEIDTVWLYSSVRGAKTAHSVTKRLSSSSPSGDLDKDTLQLNFISSPRLDVLARYLDAECHRVDPARFPAYHNPPTESEVLEAIGWHPSQTGGEEKNWEDEQWEMTEVKEDVKSNMHKGAKEWKKFCVAFAKDPEKAMKK